MLRNYDKTTNAFGFFTLHRVVISHRAATAIDFQGAKADLFKTKGGHFCLVKNIRYNSSICLKNTSHGQWPRKTGFFLLCLVIIN